MSTLSFERSHPPLIRGRGGLTEGIIVEKLSNFQAAAAAEALRSGKQESLRMLNATSRTHLALAPGPGPDPAKALPAPDDAVQL